MIINEKNYYEVNNKGLSQSKIKDFLLDKNYFYRKHITGELEKEQKKSWDVGKAIDSILTGEDSIDNYVILTIPDGEKDTYWRTKEGRGLKASYIESGKTILSEKDYNQIIEVSDAVEKTSAYREIKKNYISQQILEVKANLGKYFKVLYGKPDFFNIKDGVCRLVDLKSANELDDNPYYYNFRKYGYSKQLWFYAYLLQILYPEIKSFEYYHLAVEKAEPFRVKLFRIPNSYIDDEGEKMLETIQEIACEKEFKKNDASFNNPILLLDPKDK